MGAVAAELQSIGHRPNFFYLQHAMGLASSMGLGIALSRPELQVVVFDGDGSLLMNLGGLTTLARYRPRNLVHVVFDNESLLSVGGFPTATSTGSDLAGIAAAAGVPRTATVRTLDEFSTAFDDALAAQRADDDRREGRSVGPSRLRHRPRAAREPLRISALASAKTLRHVPIDPARDVQHPARNSSPSSNAGTLQRRRPDAAARPGHAGDRPAADVRARRPASRSTSSRATTTRGRRGTGTRSAWASTPARTSTRRSTGSPARTCPTTPATRSRRGASSARRA